MKTHVELSSLKRQKVSQSSSNSEKTSSVNTVSRRAIGMKRVYPEDVDRLPSHLRDECVRLKKLNDSGTMLTEPLCRPLVHSTCIWLLHQGVTNKVDHPDVIAKVRMSLSH